MENITSIPEIAISPTTTQPKSEVMDREMEDLLSENKHLKTSLHWISDELNKLKSEKQIQVMRVMNSGCLEEGLGKLTVVNPINTKNMDISTYVNHLHITIKTLKSQLSRSLYYLQRIDSNKLKLNMKQEPSVKVYRKDSSEVAITNCESGYGTNIMSNGHLGFQRQEGNQVNRTAQLENTEGNDLYPSLLHNLQAQQTKTYLNSNAQQMIRPAFPRVQSSPNVMTPFRKIEMYDEYTSD